MSHDLLIENARSVMTMIESNSDDSSLSDNELVCQPSDRVRFSATRRMLNKVTPSNALFADSLKQLPHDVKLM